MLVDAVQDEDSGRWFGLVPDVPSIYVEAATRQAALASAMVLATRVRALRERDAQRQRWRGQAQASSR